MRVSVRVRVGVRIRVRVEVGVRVPVVEAAPRTVLPMEL